MTPVKVASIIRFHLSELSARNAHHEFEHLARHLARARLYSNILPATGPVSAGGDRGRDFESFHTRITVPATAGSTFSERTSQDMRVVFACSLEKTIASKIRGDIKTILADGSVDEIIYFCEQDVPISKRLELIDEAKQKAIDLQIFDGTAIAEWLSEPDIFWIAQEYLHLPAEINPSKETDSGYAAHRRDWERRIPLLVSRADFLAIKAGLRHATFNLDARADLSLWLEKMAAFLADVAPRDIVRDAMYEIAVANLRGRGDMTAQAELIADYFSDVAHYTGIGGLIDAKVLLTYCFGGFRLNQFRVAEAELYERRQNLIETIEDCLHELSIGPGRRSGLLRVRGGLELLPSAPGTRPDIARAFAIWREMLDHAQEAPLFPIEEFADHLTVLAKQMGEVEELLALVARTDDLVAVRAGQAVVGEKAIDLAFSFLERGQPTTAIRQLHKTKTKWFSGEQIGEALRVLLLLAEQYRMLGLAYAAKYHAMAAAVIARYEQPRQFGELQSEALFELLDAEDAAGNSLGFLQLFPVVIAVHLQHDERPLDTQKHPKLSENMGQLSALLGFLKRGNPQARKVVDQLAVMWPAPIKDPIWRAAAKRSGFWNKGSWKEAWSGLEEALLDRPFGDLGPERRVRWRALGISWTCEFTNDYLTTPTAEQLIAELQIAACALADRDLGVVPCDAIIKVEVSPNLAKLDFARPTEDERAFKIMVPSTDRGVGQVIDVIEVFVAIIHASSVLSDQALMQTFDKSVLESIFCGRPYAELYREFVPEDLFAETARQATTRLDPDREFNSRAGERVRWFDGRGPTYDEEGAKLDIEHRYKCVQASLHFTLERLLNDHSARLKLQRMHDKGMKDWEVLSILSNIAMNLRMGERDDLSTDELRELGQRLASRPEVPDDALDPTLFSDQQIELTSKMYLAAFLNGRELHAPTLLNWEGLEQFLVARYRLREDDVAHFDIFGWSKIGDNDAAASSPLGTESDHLFS